MKVIKVTDVLKAKSGAIFGKLHYKNFFGFTIIRDVYIKPGISLVYFIDNDELIFNRSVYHLLINKL